MTTKVMRKIIKIDEGKCNGCGNCVTTCAEGALKIIDGKARLVSETYCDGLGACIGECPQGALTIEERPGEAFSEEAANHHLSAHGVSEPLPCGCPSTEVVEFNREDIAEARPGTVGHQPSMLRQWPVQLALVPPGAPFLTQADLLLTADCVPFACGSFHQDLLKGHALLVACPKLDNFEAHLKKLTEILRRSEVRSLTVAHMEVPCCFGLVHMAKQAVAASGKDIPLREITIGVKGDLVSGFGKGSNA